MEIYHQHNYTFGSNSTEPRFPAHPATRGSTNADLDLTETVRFGAFIRDFGVVIFLHNGLVFIQNSWSF